MDRAMAALIVFVERGWLSLNPEHLREIAGAVLEHVDTATSYEEIQAAVERQLDEVGERHDRLYKDPQGTSDGHRC